MIIGPKKTGRPSLYPDARGNILKAAQTLFGECGFDAVSISQIARQAGLPKANVLYYYPNKDDLWREAVDHLWQEVTTYYFANLHPPVEVSLKGFAHFLRTYFMACRAFPAYVQIPFLEGQTDNWRSRYLADKYVRSHHMGARKFIIKLSNAGIIRPINIAVLHSLIAGGGQMVIGQSFLWRYALHESLTEAEFDQFYIESVLDIFKMPGT